MSAAFDKNSQLRVPSAQFSPLPTSHFLLLTKRGGNKSECVPVTLHIFQGQNAFAVGLDENTDKRERPRPRQNGTRWVTQHMVVLHHPHKPD
jgi:hypothetical protein